MNAVAGPVPFAVRLASETLTVSAVATVKE